MEAEAIDDLLDDIIQNETYNSRIKDEIYIKQMESIEQGNYEYFKSKLNDPLYRTAVLNLMLYASNKEDIKNIVANNEKYNINSDRLIGLICATNDYEFIILCIEKRKEYGFSIEEVFRLIKATKNKEFMKDAIRNYHLYGLNGIKIRELIKIIDDAEFAKECINDRKKYGLLPFMLADIIILGDDTKDKSYIKNFIENSVNGKSDIIFTSEYDMCNLIKATGDDDYIKLCIKEKEKYKLSMDRIVSLIITIGDSQYADECIDNSETFEFTSEDIMKIIVGLEDVDYIKKWVQDVKKREKAGISNSQLINLILEVNDSKYVEECIKNRTQLNLDMTHAVQLIIATNNAKFIEECIENRVEFELSPSEVGSLICETGDSSFIIHCLEHRFEELQIKQSGRVVEMIGATLKDRRDKGKFLKKCINEGLFNLSAISKTILIRLYNNPNYTKFCIKNAEKIGLNQGDFLDLVLKTNDPGYIEKYLKRIEQQIDQPANNDIILPDTETIGIEIETVGRESTSVHEMTNVIAKDWKAKNDGSLIFGAEVTSPILHSSDENKKHSIYQVCRRLEAIRTSSK